ncbi:hypothetical protein O3P69_012005 [Scylla paramamosain]|uniref:Uncharacterized protein n=1 Tax=Scylla paramamosain TaxID=85552 RepID=A0AAW0SF98_SCYPA
MLNIKRILDRYKTKLSLPDQDILNILFSNETTAKRLYELGCEWNYREKLCSWGSSKCKCATWGGSDARGCPHLR